MEFWGIEVKPGETVKYQPKGKKYLHLSQATLGEPKKEGKASESAIVYLTFENKKLVIGTLSADRCPQISYDLVFEKDFELSHNWKNGSIFFVGYKVASEGADDFSDDTDSELEYKASPVAKNAKESKEEKAKAKLNLKKADAKAPSPKEEEAAEENKKIELNDREMIDVESESPDEEDEITPKKEVDQKKRRAEPAPKTPQPEKKTKIVTPQSGQKTIGDDEGKKGGGHQATPHPAKQAGKTPATTSDKSGRTPITASTDKSPQAQAPVTASTDRSKQAQAPKSGGAVACPSCPKTFKDEKALKSHSLAKHPAQ